MNLLKDLDRLAYWPIVRLIFIENSQRSYAIYLRNPLYIFERQTISSSVDLKDVSVVGLANGGFIFIRRFWFHQLAVATTPSWVFQF